MNTLISLVLDRSGSMHGKESDVIGGVNTFIREQKTLPGEARISISTFADFSTPVYYDQDLRYARELTQVDYRVGGSTALIDSVMNEMKRLDGRWGQFYPDKTIVVVVTDGQENMSRSYNKATLAGEIKSREKTSKWSFIYMGADVNAFSDAGALGFDWYNTAKYTDTGLGTQTAYFAASASVGALRGGALNASLGKELGEKLKL